MRGPSSTPVAAESGPTDGPGRDETKIEVNNSSKEADVKDEKEKEGTEAAKAASPANYGVGVHQSDLEGGFAEQGCLTESSLVWNEEGRCYCHAHGSDLLHGVWSCMCSFDPFEWMQTDPPPGSPPDEHIFRKVDRQLQ